jgi:hypothetical protein
MSWLKEIEESTTLRYAMKLRSIGLKISKRRLQRRVRGIFSPAPTSIGGCRLFRPSES